MTFWEIARIMLPIALLIRLAEVYGLLELVVPSMRPVMAIVDLPPEAALVVLSSIFTGLYGAIATLPILIGLELSAAQVTSICMIMLIAHGIPVEQAIVKRAGGSFVGTTLLRLVVAFIAAFIIAKASSATGFLSHTQSLEHFKEFSQTDKGNLDWVISSLKGLAALFVILVLLLIMMDAFDRFRITPLLNNLLSPLMRLSGLDRSVTSITTAGILLGLAYGGALIIARGNDPSITPQAKKYALCWLSLCHGLIEDVALMVVVGGDFYVLFFGRIVLTLLIVRALMLWDQFALRSGAHIGVRRVVRWGWASRNKRQNRI